MDVRGQVRRFIVESFYVPEAEVGDDSLLVTDGVVDSTGMLELIAFLEAEFGIAIADHETTPENLETVARIAAFVSRKLGGAEPRAPRSTGTPAAAPAAPAAPR